MRDATTIITETAAPAPSASELRQAPATRTKLVPTQKLTRAHVAVDARPRAFEMLAQATGRVAQKIGAQLKTTVTCKPSLLPSTLHPFSHLAARALFVSLELGGDALGILELDGLGAGALIGRITSANEPVGLPTRLSSIEEAALGWIFLSTLAELRAEPAFAPFTPRLLSMTLDRGEVLQQLDARRRHVAVQLELRIGETNCLARMLLPALWLQSKAEALATELTPPALDEVLAATLPATCIIGSALLPKKDAESLAPGDVVLFSGVSQRSRGLIGPGRVTTPSFELRGTFTEAGFTLTRALERPTQESAMSHVDPSIPVEVEVELTRLRLPLHQLGLVRPGSVIPLHINAAQQVVVRIGDKAVARAELVEIEGEIGARIISML